MNQDLAAHARLWLGAAGRSAQTRLFRKVFHLPAAASSAHLLIYAEACYNAWVKGR